MDRRLRFDPAALARRAVDEVLASRDGLLGDRGDAGELVEALTAVFPTVEERVLSVAADVALEEERQAALAARERLEAGLTEAFRQTDPQRREEAVRRLLVHERDRIAGREERRLPRARVLVEASGWSA